MTTEVKYVWRYDINQWQVYMKTDGHWYLQKRFQVDSLRVDNRALSNMIQYIKNGWKVTMEEGDIKWIQSNLN